jgi:sulfoxide reductase catalytic subunit YedY
MEPSNDDGHRREVPVPTHPRIRSSEITPESIYWNRRRWLAAAAGALVAGRGSAGDPVTTPVIRGVRRGTPSTDEPTTPWSAVTTYNNYYEFGSDKDDPSRLGGAFQPTPWSVAIEGEVRRPGIIALEDLIRPHALEERVYRLRCVEAWSMVIPWVGFPLVELIKRLEPTSRAKYVAFESVYRPEEMPGQAQRILEFPYREGLRIDEATHPLTLVVIGLYGRLLPNQNGAPIRIVVPWKYGYKSIKSIVRIRLQEHEPPTTWNRMAPREYGFYSNVNPDVDHPRWSQRFERRIGEWFRRPTLPFNGYAAEVAHLYAGLDPRTLY